MILWFYYDFGVAVETYTLCIYLPSGKTVFWDSEILYGTYQDV